MADPVSTELPHDSLVPAVVSPLPLTERTFLFAVFFASGFAALLYQTIWQRMLTLFGGADIYSITIIVSAFMAGLGFGNLAGGHLADRLSLGRCIRMFAVCELAIGLFALLSRWIYYDWLYSSLGTTALPRGSLAGLIFIVTLWPTFFMGMSLPLVARLVSRSVDDAGRWIPALYGWNTVGAAAGSLFAAVVLFQNVDFPTSVNIGAVLSLTCAAAALALAPRFSQDDRHPAPLATPAAAALPAAARRLPLPTWLVIYALSGFVALSLEIVWFRVLGIVLKSNASTFGFLLSVFLLGVGAGSLVARHRRLLALDPVPAFFLFQTLSPLWAAASLAVLTAAVDRVSIAQPLWAFFASANPLESVFRSVRGLLLYGILGFGLIFPATLCMGLSFGFLQRAVQTDPRLVGRRLGWLQTANILGSMAGALITGLYLLSWLGSAATLQLLLGAGLLFAGLRWLTSNAASRRSSAALALGLVATAALMPGHALFWSRLHGAWPTNTIAREGASGVVLLKDEPSGQTRVFVMGISQSWLPYGSVHTALGALPVLIHPNPERIAIIGLGSGDTAFAMGARRETRTIDSIEIMNVQLGALQELASQRPLPALQMLLRDPRVRHRFTDARNLLRRGGARYDIIEADALLPRHAYAGNLYSVEYFELLRDCLTPGGAAVTWTPTERTRASILRVFPHVLMFRSMAIGSSVPIAYDANVVRARLQDPHVQRYYAEGQVDAAGAVKYLLNEGPVVYGADFDRSTLTDVNRDLFPQDEFGRPYVGPENLADRR